MLRFSEWLSDPSLETCQGQVWQELCGLRPRRAWRWARSGLGASVLVLPYTQLGAVPVREEAWR